MNKKLGFVFFISWIALSLVSQNRLAPKKGFVSWLPAAQWDDALLTGNGTMGAMVMGKPFEESIILNHALLYLPSEAPVIPPDMASHMEQIKKLSLDGKYGEVAKLGAQIWRDAGYGNKKWTDAYVPAAELSIHMPASNIKAYERSVDYETAEAIVAWTDQKGSYVRKTFASRPNGVIVTQIKGTAPVSVKIQLAKYPHSWEQNKLIDKLISESDTYVNQDFMHYHVAYGQPHSASPDGYDGLLKVMITGGEKVVEGDAYTIKNADEVLILTTMEPYKADNSSSIDRLKERLRSAGDSYAFLLSKQKQTHGLLYNSVSLDLACTEQEEQMTSEVLVSTIRDHTTPGFMQRQFEAARYHILCATGTNPPNLQGIWSGSWTPPWSSDFTHDGNVQVAISHLLNGNMPELMMAYFNYHERMMAYYRTNAKQLYGVRGIHIPSHTSSHGYNNHYDETWCMEYWNGGAGWTASYFYDYYLFTGDRDFLKERAFPFMTEALLFWEDFLTMGDDGKYMIVPSYSPENNPLEHRWQNCINATMDVMIIKELTNNWINAAKILGLSAKEIKEKEVFFSLLPDYQVSEDGVLREWLWEGLTDNQAHRHASHLYGLYEVPDKEILASESLQQAVIKTIHERMKIRKAHQGGEMAFGMCHLGFAAVNMKDKETAVEILRYLSQFYWTNAMATTHNPGQLFNMDISGGIPSLMTRMIVNSRPGHITLFAALPDEWHRGALNGVLARGGVKFDYIRWDEQKADVCFVSKEQQIITLDFGSDVQLSGIVVDGAKYRISDNRVILSLQADFPVKLSINK